jgi:hypothetical protein
MPPEGVEVGAQPREELILSFSGAYSTVDPSAFEMPDTPANEAGVFLIFEGDLQEVRYWPEADIPLALPNVRFRG